MPGEDVDTEVNVDDKLKSLKRSRGGHKSYATKIAKETAGLLVNVDGNPDSEDDIRTNYLIISEKIAIIKGMDTEIQNFLTDDKTYDDEFLACNDYHRSLLKILVSIEQWEKRKGGNPVPSSGNTPTTSQAKLPKLTLKKFNGDPLMFRSFWDSFESAVDRNNSLDDIAKFNYLKGLLEGKASLVLQGLSLTSENYNNAITLLKERFGDPQVIITAHMDALLAISPVASGNVSALRDICDIIEVHTRNLQLFEISANHYGPVLISIIMSKLPTQIKLEISRQMPQGKWEINQLMEALKKEIVSRERCTTEDSRQSAPIEVATSSTLHSQGRNYKSNKGMFCAFCTKSHQSSLCRTVSSVDERKSCLRRKNKCYVCLKSNHFASKCFSKRSCLLCGGRHHDSICVKNEHPAGEQISNTSLTTNVSDEQKNKCILLQTAQSVVYNNNSHNTLLIRLLFDNCSQKSFITSALRNRLCLPTIKRETLTVKTFASTVKDIQTLDVVNLKIKNRKNSNCNIIEV